MMTTTFKANKEGKNWILASHPSQGWINPEKSKKSKVMPLIDENRISNKNSVRDDKIDELYGFCMDTEEEDRKIRMELLVNNIIASMTDTCKNILHGYYWDDFSTSTIADMFSFSDSNSVKAQKYKCVKKFRDKYNELRNKIYG